MYYGQFLDDKLIEEYFDSGYIGGCIDVGATNGVDINNTKYFEENGWYCLCIEPNTNSYEKLKINRKNTLNLAISNINKDLVDFTVVNLNNNSSESEGAISSLNLDEKLYQDHLNMGFNITTEDIKVSTRTLDYCIENYYKYDKIDFLDIDTEGTELDVLKGFDINRWQPKLIVVENNYNDNIVEDYLRMFQYIKDKRVGVNDYYIKHKKKKFLIGPKLGDFFHSLYVVKCLSNGFKSDVYLIDETNIFKYGLENTYSDIYLVVKKQPYIDDFLIYSEDIKDYIKIGFHHMDYLFKFNWYEIYKKIFNLNDKFEKQPWLSVLDINEYNLYKNKVVLHFSKFRYHDAYDELVVDILTNNDCLFIGSEDEYQDFKHKELVKFKSCDNFFELYSIIEKCKFFIGNQSMPLALAHGLFKPHLGFLITIDAIHYKDNNNKKYFWLDTKLKISENFKELNKFIKIKDHNFTFVERNLDNIQFDIIIDKESNKIIIGCDLDIYIYIIFYEYNIETGEKTYFFSTGSNFNFNSFWYLFSRSLKDMKFIMIEFSYDENIIKEEIIKIE